MFMFDEIQNAKMCHIGIWNKKIQVVVLLVFHFFYFIVNRFHPATEYGNFFQEKFET